MHKNMNMKLKQLSMIQLYFSLEFLQFFKIKCLKETCVGDLVESFPVALFVQNCKSQTQ